MDSAQRFWSNCKGGARHGGVDELLVHGGYYIDDERSLIAYNDLWKLDTSAYTWVELSQIGDVPAIRFGHRLALLSSYIVSIGGNH